MKSEKHQVVVKLYGDRDLIKTLLDILEQKTISIPSRIMASEKHGDYHAFITVLGVDE